MIFACVVVMWVAYVVPLVLRRYDDASKTSSLGSFSSLSRVISRPSSDEVSRSDSTTRAAVIKAEAKPQESVTETAPAAEIPDEDHETVTEFWGGSSRGAAPRPVNRAAARIAARRRRRVLITLLTSLVVVAGLAVAGIIAAPWVAAPAAVVVAWLVACRIQVRGERGLRKPSRREAQRRAADSAADAEETVVLSGQFEDVEPDRPHVMAVEPLAANALDEQLVIAVPSISTTGEALWDPLPVTLPTYVTKPRVGRTVRTIDFGQAGAWSSGHVEADDAELPLREQAGDDGDAREAVGH